MGVPDSPAGCFTESDEFIDGLWCQVRAYRCGFGLHYKEADTRAKESGQCDRCEQQTVCSVSAEIQVPGRWVDLGRVKAMPMHMSHTGCMASDWCNGGQMGISLPHAVA